VEDTARRIMSAIFTADLARGYSFLGKAKKHPFHSLVLKSVVYGTIAAPFSLHLLQRFTFRR
jgi:hypothetical protein